MTNSTIDSYRRLQKVDTVFAYLKTGERVRILEIGGSSALDADGVCHLLTDVQSFNLGYAR
jgi:putative NADH-flavin reductase